MDVPVYHPYMYLLTDIIMSTNKKICCDTSVLFMFKNCTISVSHRISSAQIYRH